jgi:hypothetical protein
MGHINNQIVTNIAKPCTGCSIIGITPDLVYTDGSKATISQGPMLHHAMFAASGGGKSDATCAGKGPGLLGERFFASDDERTAVDLQPLPKTRRSACTGSTTCRKGTIRSTTRWRSRSPTSTRAERTLLIPPPRALGSGRRDLFREPMSISAALVRRSGKAGISDVSSPRETTRKDGEMRVMAIVKATKDSEAGVMPSEELLAEMGEFNEEMVKAGVLLAGEGLHPTSKGARVSFGGDSERTVIDGPFAETKELIAGYWLMQVGSFEEAVEWIKRCPNPHNEPGEIEIRQVFEAEDFGEEFTPELREQEERIRAQAEQNQ